MTPFWRGFRAMLPLWLGMVPFGAAYAVSARAAGLNPFETQLMSLAVFAGGAQFSAAGLFAAGASPFTLVATTFLINARHVLYGVSLGQAVRFGPRERLLAAHLLTDEAYGVTFGSPERSARFFLGAGSSPHLRDRQTERGRPEQRQPAHPALHPPRPAERWAYPSLEDLPQFLG